MFDLEALRQRAALVEFGASEVRDGVATIDGQPIALADLDQARLDAAVLAQLRPEVIGAIESVVSSTRRALAQATPEEMAAWSTKAAAARAMKAGSEAPPIIAAEAVLTGEAPAELAERIIANAAIFEALEAKLTGLRRKYSRAVRDAETHESALAALSAAQAACADLIAAAQGA